MKLKSLNIYYIIGIIPLTVINFILGIKLASNKIWLACIISIIGIAVISGLIKKFMVMPYSVASYGKLIPLSLDLPVESNTLLYTSETMDKYDFLSRTVEIISPIRQNGKFIVAVNPKLLRKYGKNFTKCAVVRELKKYSTASGLKVILGLVIPMEVLASIIMSVFAFHLNLSKYFSGFVINFILPFIVVVIFGFTLYTWNRFVSKQDMKLDRYLLEYFSSSDVAHYVKVMNELQSMDEKDNSKKFNQHYSEERLKNIS
ncbi:MAG TPA: hypothetical protein DDY59_01195 [Lachnospiraceae bacterium]|jgi:hypothetical protein|nr:hypothetical protein [Lachnospiraceae bacterium]HCM11573.1 hypothetical protein [Lachnospiraceae bacterium]